MIQTLGQPPVDSILDASTGSIDVSQNIHWVNWLSLIFNILINVGPTFRKVALVTFPPCPPQSSVDVLVPFAGVAPAVNPGDMAPVVTLGLPSAAQFTVNNGFLAFVSAPDVVTIREFCVDAFGIGPFTDTFTIMVSTGEPAIQ